MKHCYLRLREAGVDVNPICDKSGITAPWRRNHNIVDL